MWEPKQHTTLAKCSAKKQIRSAEKAISLDKVTSSPEDGFVLVLSKLSQRRMRAAAKVSKATPHAKNVSVHKTVASDSVPPDIAKAPYVEPTNQQAPLMFSGTSLEEWPVLAKRTPPLKRASPTQPFLAPVTPRRREPTSSSTSTKVLVPLSSSKL
jgi:hypothetical protein